jgi:hypothetical protein
MSVDPVLKFVRSGASDGVTAPDANPIIGLLTAAGIPWQSTRQELADRYGIRGHPVHGWDVIEIPSVKPLVSGMLWPLSALVMPQFAPRLPVVEFSSETWFDGNSRDNNSRGNLRRTARQLEPQLGKARIVKHYNTMQCQWTAGAATLSLTAWPPEFWAGYHLVSPGYDPRLRVACHLRIDTGFMLPATPQELAWLSSFEPIAPIVATPAVRELQLEFIRAPAAGSPEMIEQAGTSADRAALIIYGKQLYIVPAADIIRFRVERRLPANDSGRSWLMVDCHANYDGLETKTLWFATAPGADDLNGLAAELAGAIGKPVVLCAYD